MKTFALAVVLVAAFFLVTSDAFAAIDTCVTTDASTSTQYINTQITLKILLVEFPDVPHRTSPSAYRKADFENMLGSNGIYVTPNMHTPDTDAVYGSLRDYFIKMSSGNVTVSAVVVNNAIRGFPLWVMMNQTKAYYDNPTSCTFFSDATTRATQEGLDVSTNATTKLVIIYAGNTYFLRQISPGVYRGGCLNPQAGGNIYIMGERQGSPHSQENSTDKFSRIGIHCHEFAHLLGIGHSSGSRADLMQAGTRNGPDHRGAAPAPINPAHRALKGWLSPIPISGQQQFDAYYSLTAPQVFRINSNSGSDYFLIENGRFNQTMVIGTTTVPDYNNAAFFPPAWPHGSISQGIFVWRVIGGYPGSYWDNGLVYASGRYGQTWPEGTPSETDDAVPFPGHRNVRVFSPWSDSRNPTPEAPPGSGIFVPNSRYGSNVGMEVLSENPAQGYFEVMLYQQAPEDASPSMPQNVTISLYQDPLGYRYPRINWTAMQEPDVTSGGKILVHRRTKILSPTWSAWALFDSLSGSSAQYTDMSIGTAGNGTDSVQYRIQARDNTGKLSMFSDVVSMNVSSDMWKPMVDPKTPKTFALLDNYPNPFNPSTQLGVQLADDGLVILKVFDVLGREVATLMDGFYTAGSYPSTFQADRVSSGVYFARLTVANSLGREVYTRSMKLLLAR